MVSRDANLQAVLDLMCRSVAADPRLSGAAERTLGIVEERLCLPPDGGALPPEPMRLPVCALLGEALSPATPLLEAFGAVEPRLGWHRRKGDDGDDRFKACHANTLLVGPGGLEPRTDLWVGATLMAPNTAYPVHHHPPQEIYLVLSEGEWWKAETGWFSPGPGGTVHNRPDALHAFRSGAKPLLALWALPI
jgi:Dimethlysulfonioproprionate lyase